MEWLAGPPEKVTLGMPVWRSQVACRSKKEIVLLSSIPERIRSLSRKTLLKSIAGCFAEGSRHLCASLMQ